MKVIHLVPHLESGGAETLIKDYALNINKKKFELIILTVDKSNNSYNEKLIKQKNIKIIHLADFIPFDKKDNLFEKTIKKIKRYYLFNQIITKENPHIIHSHLQTNDFLFFYRKKTGVKLFHTLHSEVNILFKRYLSVYTLATKYCVKKKNMVLITLHERMNEEASLYFNTSNCFVIHNGIDIRRFQDTRNINKIKKQIGVENKNFIVGHIGRFSYAKNHKFVVDLFNQLSKSIPSAALILIGTGELEETVKRKVKELHLENCVFFLGVRSDIPELLSIMDVLVFPSIYEGFGNVLLEAQASKIKCVVSEEVPKETHITNYITSIDLEAPLEKWCELITDKSRIEDNSINLQKYDIKNIIKNLEQLYLKM